ncbi:pentatricopeptide repeat-containing protein At4g18975, chloroplastic [Cornus florida]|uniref:pentatricopeptide repeat-containing protein At4g18975, chloroplastic n=1 Tax=Cornus florida TaxID=4283 RepID=UPI0028999443|nr:pentatricopeptide repeat-containing protein At4g18975, chloroplastic [Cornus florida]
MAMSRSAAMAKLVRQITQLGMVRVQTLNCSYSTMVQAQMAMQRNVSTMSSPEDQSGKDAGGVRKHQIGENVSRKDKINFLVNTLLDLKDSKEEVYGAMDTWVAWEQNFPIGPLKRALLLLEKEQQWHRVIQVLKWMLSKGQGTTMGTYEQLIRALDMDHRAEEAHVFWVKKIGSDLHSVPWKLCDLMISVYYRNNMLENLVNLFKRLEAFNRKPLEKSTVQRVADAYEMLGLPEEKERVLEKYKHLFTKTWKGSPKKSKKIPLLTEKKDF